LGFRPTEERQHILALLRKTGNPQDWLAHHPERLDTILCHSAATRLWRARSNLSGGWHDRPFDDGLSGIAVPIVARNRVHGAINIIWVRRAMTVEEMVAQHLADLQAAASEIASAIE